MTVDARAWTAEGNVHRLWLGGCEPPLIWAPAVEALFQSALGLPRQINRIGHYALSAAEEEAKTVNAEHLQHALKELQPRLDRVSSQAPR